MPPSLLIFLRLRRDPRFKLQRQFCAHERREARREKILSLYLQCYTAEEVGEAVGLSREAAQKEIEELVKNAELHKLPKVQFSDFQPPI